jgi:DNA-binding NarL/FixJ family response regulator/signal transduction histidine kinase
LVGTSGPQLANLSFTARHAGDLSRTIGGARDAHELAVRIADAIETFAERPRLRLWRVRIGEVAEVTSTGDLEGVPACPPHAVLRATASADPMTYGDCQLVAVRNGTVPVAVIEIRGGGRDAAAVVATAAEGIGRHLGLIWAARSGEHLAVELRASGLARETQSVILTFSAQVQGLLGHDRLSVYLLTPDGGSLERFAVACWPPIPGEMDVRPMEAVGISRVIKTNTPIVSADFGTDDRIRGEEDAIIARAGFHGCVSVPLRLVGSAFGVLNFVSRTTGFYTEQDIPVAQQIADQIAVFLYDLRLQRATRDQLRRDAVQGERDRVAREFHDTLAQSLARLSVKAQVLEQQLEEGMNRERAAELTHIAQDALAHVRHSLVDTIPIELQHQTLAEAIAVAADRFHQDTGVAPALDVVGDPRTASLDVQGAVLRIVQECLANAAKHAAASEMSVALHIGNERLSLAVRDNGGGFEGPAARGYGLRAMGDRARDIGGELAVVSREGGPTEIHLIAPVDSGVRPPAAETAEASPTVIEPTIPQLLRVLIVDDHAIFAQALAELLAQRPDFRVVGEAGTGGEGIALAKLLRPDVVLLDLDLPDARGVDIVGRLHAIKNPPVVLMLSAFGEGEHVAASLAAGARGYIAKTTHMGALVDAIHSAMRGNFVVNAASWNELVTSRVKLTAREFDVLHLLASGASNRDIGAAIHVAPKTVERSVATIVTKLGARNRTHAVALAIAGKLVDPRPLQVVG